MDARTRTSRNWSAETGTYGSEQQAGYVRPSASSSRYKLRSESALGIQDIQRRKTPLTTVTRHIDAERLTPTDASLLTGIPYEILLRHARGLERKGLLKLHRESNRILFNREDLEVLKEHDEGNPRGTSFRVEGNADLHKRLLSDLAAIADHLEAVANKARGLVNLLKKAPVSSTTWIKTLPVEGVTLRQPIPVSVVSDGKAFSASSGDIGSTATGPNRVKAVRALRMRLATEYVFLRQLSSLSEAEGDRLAELQRFIRDAG
jgi:hypothetical protein